MPCSPGVSPSWTCSAPARDGRTGYRRGRACAGAGYRTRRGLKNPDALEPGGVATTAETERWLLEEGDPSVRARTMRELSGRAENDGELAAAREEIGVRGWAAAILRQQLPSGAWDTAGTSGEDLYLPKYIATNWRLLVLSDLGLTRRHPAIDRAVRLLIDRWDAADGSLGGSDSEACVSGNALRFLERFGYGEEEVARRTTDWLLRSQKADGGWHCFPSEHGTLDAWEPLAALAEIPSPRRSPPVRRAIEQGAEFFLERRLLFDGETRYPPWFRLHYPQHYYYDLLVGLDILTRLGYGADPRIRPALEALEALRGDDGRWRLDALHPDLDPSTDYLIRTPFYPFGLELPGRSSQWITMTALLVRHRAEGRSVR
jgi:hypothetical protein